MTRVYTTLRTALILATLTPVGPATTPDTAGGQQLLIEPGVDVVSRFIYRGNRLGDAPQAQPSLTVSYGRLDVGVWGSHPLTYDGSGPDPYKEAIAWVAYEVPLAGGDGGALVPYIQSHYAVSAGSFIDADSHYLQTQLSWIGPETLPLDFMVGVVVYNDPDNSVYMEAGYRTTVGDTGLRLFAGGTPASSPFNGTDEAAFTNVGVAASWALGLGEEADLRVGIDFIVNPHTGEAYPVLGVGL